MEYTGPNLLESTRDIEAGYLPMLPTVFIRLLTIICLVMVPVASFADAVAVDRAVPIQRQVLGVYHAADGFTLEQNPLRQGVEVVLHHLGLHLDYADLAKGLPDEDQMAGYRGVIVWLETDRIPDAEAYWTWLDEQLRSDRRVILLGRLGPVYDSDTDATVPAARINAVAGRLGLRLGTRTSRMPLDIEIVHKDSTMVEFERGLQHEAIRFDEIRSLASMNEVFLRLRMKSTGAFSDPVVLGPRGGYAANGYIRYIDEETEKLQWRLNPFAFFERGLDVTGLPRLDCTTRNGSRLYYSHIDGDGLVNRTRIQEDKASGEVILEQILEPYADLPFTVSVIVAEVHPEIFGTPGTVQLARKLLSLSNVEAASHTHTHPLVWDRALEGELGFAEYFELSGVTENGQAVLPWTVPDYAFDPVAETVGSCQYIENELLPPGKGCELLLWSGNCLPGPRSLAACEAGGLANMNGGDSRLDGEYPSYHYVAPLYRQHEGFYQIHSSNSNENTYTDLWSGPFGGYVNAIQTFVNTDFPRRILPVNVYYHFYSGERQAALEALRIVYRWVHDRRRDLFPLYASEYVRVVRGFISAQIDSLGDRRWRITDYGDCRTVRFDETVAHVDMNRSEGVLGYRHHQGNLYVALAESVGECVIALTDTAPTEIYLTAATAPVREVQIVDDWIEFASVALDTAWFDWANLPASTDFDIQVTTSAKVATASARSDDAGRLRLALHLGAEARILARVR